MRIRVVEDSRPIHPVVRSARRIEIAALTTVLPSSRVHSNRLPWQRMGRMAVALFLSHGSPACSNILRPTTSRRKRPKVNPAKSAVKGIRAQASAIATGALSSPSLEGSAGSGKQGCKQALNKVGSSRAFAVQLRAHS